MSFVQNGLVLMKIAILTVSDRGYRGEREDTAGPAIAEELAELCPETIARDIVPDEPEMIAAKLRYYADELGIDLAITTGGTGFSPRDVTPEATNSVIDRQVPGIAEAMRHESLKITPRAMLSRATSGIRKSTLIINLPGSPKACRECLQTIKPALVHGVEVLGGNVDSCARPDEHSHQGSS